MKTNRLLVLGAAALALVGCSQSAPKCLVLYYSQTGVTEAVAQEISGKLGVEAFSFNVEQPYDGTYEETIGRCIEERESGALSALVPLDVDLADYDIIFLGYPVWFGTYARPVASLLEEYDFAGKTVVPFATFGSGGLESSVKDLREACPEATVLDGYGVRAARLDKAAQEVEQWLINEGYLEGEAEVVAPYGEEHPVTPEETEIFNAACGDYPMPIGTPVSACSREKGENVEYVVTVKTDFPNGEESTAYVCITCAPDAAPEFTKVIR